MRNEFKAWLLLHFTDIVKMFSGSAFMGVNYGWECLLQTEDNRDRRSGHVQSRSWGDGEFDDPDSPQILRKTENTFLSLDLIY